MKIGNIPFWASFGSLAQWFTFHISSIRAKSNSVSAELGWETEDDIKLSNQIKGLVRAD